MAQDYEALLKQILEVASAYSNGAAPAASARSCPSDPGLVCIPYETNHTMDIVVAYHGK